MDEKEKIHQNKNSFKIQALRHQFMNPAIILLARMVLFLLASRVYALKLPVRRLRFPLRYISATPEYSVTTGNSASPFPTSWKDSLVTGLNGAQDISVKVISCKQIVQEIMDRNSALSPLASKHLGEVVACTLMMGAGLKGEETFQVNLVGSKGLKTLVAITDGNLNVRGMVGNPDFQQEVGDATESPTMSEILGEGQIQVVKSHPAWKHPMNGVTELRNAPVAVNLALYMAESEQRPTAMLTDVRIEGRQCIAALAVMVETLPGATEEHIEMGIANLNRVQQKGLYSYWQAHAPTIDTSGGFIPTITGIHGGEITDGQRARAEELFEAADSPLDKILDDCLVGMDTGSIRWDRKPKFKCTCGMERVWKALRLLPRDEVQDMVSGGEAVEVSSAILALQVAAFCC
jgi:redox-regulated HSP33 family molecular chaperone